MSIVPINDQKGTIIPSPFSTNIWDWDPFKNFPEEFEFPFNLDLWHPFLDFPSSSRESFPFRPSLETQINWKETPKSHVFKAVLPGLTKDEVIVFIDDDKMLQISSDDGKFMTRFKLPENAITDQVKASMNHGVLTVTISKEMPKKPNVRVVEITE